MFGLDAPRWSAALFAMAIPLALHLWSRRPRRIVRLGSLRHLTGLPGAHAWGRRLDDLPLLLLRLGLFAAVALALTGPRWRGAGAAPGTARTFVLADPALLTDSLAFYTDPLIDSVRRAGGRIQLLQPGFPALASTTEEPAPTAPAPHLWSLLAEFDRSVPPGADLLVVSRPTAGRIGAARPALTSTVRWHPPVAAARRASVTPGRWTEEVDGWLVRRGLAAEADQGQSATETRPVTVEQILTDRSSTRISIELIANQQDSSAARLVGAAVAAAVEAATGGVASVRRVEPGVGSNSAGSARIVIWLSGQSILDPTLTALRDGAWIIQFPPNDQTATIDDPSSLHPSASSRLPATLALSVVRRRVDLPLGAPVVVDRHGAPLVTVAQVGRGRWIRFATGATSDWSDLAHDAALPELLYDLLTLRTDRTAPAPVSADQALPGHRLAGSVPTPALPLGIPLLVAAGVLLVVERLVAHRRQVALHR